MAVEVIAEIAQGYEGKPQQAKDLAMAAILGKADAIKYQIIYADELAVPEYQYYDLFKSLEMPKAVWMELSQLIKKNNLKLYLDVFGPLSFTLAKEINADGVKIHATDFFNEPLIKSVLKEFKKIFISFGGITAEELSELINRYQLKNNPQVTLMYGFQAEPTAIEKNHFFRLKTLMTQYPDLSFGFMEHAEGGTEESHYLSLLALPLGIKAIEKHLTLERTLKLEDYISALTPVEFSEFMKRVRHFEKALGKSDLALTDEELSYRQKAVKVAVARQSLKKGDTLDLNNIILKRVPPTDKTISKINLLINKKLQVDVKKDEPIKEGMFS